MVDSTGDHGQNSAIRFQVRVDSIGHQGVVQSRQVDGIRSQGLSILPESVVFDGDAMIAVLRRAQDERVWRVLGMAAPLGQAVMAMVGWRWSGGDGGGLVVVRRWVGGLRSRGARSGSAYGRGTQRIYAYFSAVRWQPRGLLHDEALGCRRCTGSAAQWNESATPETRRVVILC